MLHLSAERLAALAGEQPTSAEAAHLGACLSCARERDSQVALRRLAAAEVARDIEPITNWGGISARLRDEGLVVETPVRPVRFTATRWGLRAAAALFLVTGGLVLGRVSAGDSPLPGIGFGETDYAVDVDPVDPIDMKLVSGGNDSAAFASPDEALAVLQRAEQEYGRAAAFLMGPDAISRDASNADMIRTRLAALDAVAAATRAALYEAPHDQVINRYYLSAIGAREATLRQLGTALPAGYELNRY